MSSRGARALCPAAAVLAVALATAPAAGASADECIAAHAEGQRLRRQGRLLAARDDFIACAAESCPAIIRRECSALDGAVEAEVPTVVPALVDATGRDVRNASVKIDGSEAATALDGRTVSLDPGAHRFLFKAPSGATRTLSVVIREAEKYRRVVAELPADAVREETAEQRTGPSLWSRVPTLTYVFGGVGLAAAGSFAYFAISGRSKQSELEHCAPRCAGRDVDTMRTEYLVADVSLAVSVVSLGLGAYFFFVNGGTDAPSNDGASKAALRWSIGAAPGLGATTLSGRF